MRPIPSFFSAGALALTVMLPIAARAGAEGGAGAPSVLVSTAAVKQGSLPRTIAAYGIVKANPQAQATLAAQIAVVVADVYVRPGQPVNMGAPLLALAPTPSTQAAYVGAVSAELTAQAALSQARHLVAESLATHQQVVEAEKNASDALAALRALRAQGAAGPAVLRAPYAAVVTAVAATPHTILAQGAPLVELTQSSGLVLLAGVVPSQSTAIHAGDEAVVRAVGSSDTIKAKVALRGAAVEPGSGLVAIEIALPAHTLLLGEAAQATITIGEARGFVVPHTAVLANERGDAYVVQAVSGAAKTVPVRILASAGSLDAVEGRLDANAPLILAGNYQLRDGMKVRYVNGDKR